MNRLPCETKQGIVTGAVPIVPQQRRFLERQPVNSHHWTVSVVFDCSITFDVDCLRGAVRHCLQQHDALRLSFSKRKDGWKSVQSDAVTTVPLTYLDVTETKAKEEDLAIETAVAQIEAGFNLEAGPLLHVALFVRGGDRPDRLWIVAHELASDRQSLLILAEDLLSAYRNLEQGQSVTFSPKTCSFKRWAEGIQGLTKQPDVKNQRSYWQDILQTSAVTIPVDFPMGDNLQAAEKTVKIAISKRYTHQLLEMVRTTEADIEAFILAALLMATGEWTGTRSLQLELDVSGRQLFEHADFSKTIGPLSNSFLLKFAADLDESPAAIVHQISQSLRLVSNGGACFGWLHDCVTPSFNLIHFDYFDPLMGTEQVR
ncbi:MAG: condensation domain-containing protein, partial [Cyanobacteria bacterium P01_E01_bin.34]